jgi:hypothetical protein
VQRGLPAEPRVAAIQPRSPEQRQFEPRQFEPRLPEQRQLEPRQLEPRLAAARSLAVVPRAPMPMPQMGGSLLGMAHAAGAPSVPAPVPLPRPMPTGGLQQSLFSTGG